MGGEVILKFCLCSIHALAQSMPAHNASHRSLTAADCEFEASPQSKIDSHWTVSVRVLNLEQKVLRHSINSGGIQCVEFCVLSMFVVAQNRKRLFRRPFRLRNFWAGRSVQLLCQYPRFSRANQVANGIMKYWVWACHLRHLRPSLPLEKVEKTKPEQLTRPDRFQRKNSSSEAISNMSSLEN